MRTDSFSNSITVTGGTLVINIANGSYADCQKFCLILIQNIPDTATINMPVGITIGTDTTVYPMVRCDCTQVTACALRTRTRYPMKVATTATSAVSMFLYTAKLYYIASFLSQASVFTSYIMSLF